MPSEFTYPQAEDGQPFAVHEQDIEEGFIEKLRDLKYTARLEICDRAHSLN